MTKPTQFNCEVLLVVDEQEIDERHRLQARICSWNGSDPVFELRPLHLKQGEWFNGQHIIKAKLSMLKTVVESKMLTKALDAFEKLEKKGDKK